MKYVTKDNIMRGLGVMLIQVILIKLETQAGNHLLMQKSPSLKKEKIIPMEKTKNFFIILSLIIFNINDLSSQPILSKKIDLMIKVRILEYMNNIDSISDINQFLSANLKYKLLRSQGFLDDILFIEVHVSLDESTNFKFFIEYNFIFAYRKKNNEIFKLKGFRYNEFGRFLGMLGPDDFDPLLNLSTYDISKYKRFKKAFWVENLDINCLYLSLKKKKHTKLPCLEPAQPFQDYHDFIPD